MENLILLPTMAQKRSSNFNQYAEEATVISEETTKVKKVNHFIEANTMEIDLLHLKNDCIVPVFSKDNELTISHNAFIVLQIHSLQVKRLINRTFVFLTLSKAESLKQFISPQTNF